jgi:hypothetical protein
MAQILTIQKFLIKNWLGFLKEDYHMKVYYLMLHHILSHYIYLEWNSLWTFFFSSILIYQPFHDIFVLQKSIVKSGCTFIEKNYILAIFIIKLLMYNQFQILNLISFIIHYRCPKRGYFAKMGNETQKMSHLSVHSPLGSHLSGKQNCARERYD